MVAGTLQTKPIAVSTFNLKYVSFVCSRETIHCPLLSCGRALNRTTTNPPCGWNIRYQQFISDIAGQDIQAHNATPEGIVKVVRNWLRSASRRETIPSGSIIWGSYEEFTEKLPQTAREARLIAEELIFNDYTWMVAQWLETKGN